MKLIKKVLTGLLCVCCLSATVAGCGDKHTHVWNGEETAPTCTEQGYTTYTCDCGASYKGDYQEALEHSFSEYVPDGYATFDKNASETAVCLNAGCNATDSREIANSMLDATQFFTVENGVITDYSDTSAQPYAKIVIPAIIDNQEITEIDGYVFNKQTQLTAIIVSDGITEIGWMAFSNCPDLTELVLPASVTKMNYEILYNCNALEEIQFKGTKEQWGSIDKTFHWDDRSGVRRIICSDGIVED